MTLQSAFWRRYCLSQCCVCLCNRKRNRNASVLRQEVAPAAACRRRNVLQIVIAAERRYHSFSNCGSCDQHKGKLCTCERVCVCVLECVFVRPPRLHQLGLFIIISVISTKVGPE